jgi:hypothetical protein
MDEAEFWDRLEYRLCDALGSSPEREHHGLWCDGLIPEAHCFTANPPCIRGTAWMGGLPGQGATYQEKWTFVLTLPVSAGSLDAVRWDSLMPAAGRTDWLSFDLERRFLTIDAGAFG